MRLSFLLPRTRRERRPFSTLISITSPRFTRRFGTVSLWSRIARIIRSFLEQAERLKNGEQDWFVGALYYPHFSPEMHFCNAYVRSGVPLTQLVSPSVPPYYGVIFLREERPLTPEVLTHWVETLSRPLFGQQFSCTLAQVPSRQEAMEQFEKEMRLMR